ncbi:MAG: hypothetical protein M3115_08215 [Thermoproteota archaeon]|nr:hypothetical protein [Thermoproteota archaeon]
MSDSFSTTKALGWTWLPRGKNQVSMSFYYDRATIMKMKKRQPWETEE